MSTENTYDVVIIGGASAGLSAALQLGRLHVRTLVLDSGSPRNRFAGHMHGYLGRDHTSPLDLVADGRRELERYGVDRRDARATQVAGTADDFTVTTEAGDEFSARRVLLASGATDTISGPDELTNLWGRGVHHCPFCDGWEYTGRRVGVRLDAPEAVHQAKMLHRIAPNLVVFAADPTQEVHESLDAAGIEVVDDTIIGASTDPGGVLAGVTLAYGGTRELDALFIRPDSRPNDASVVGLGAARAELFGAEWITVDAFGQTSVPGLYAAGNVVNPMLSVPLATAAGAQAGYAIVASLL